MDLNAKIQAAEARWAKNREPDVRPLPKLSDTKEPKRTDLDLIARKATDREFAAKNPILLDEVVGMAIEIDYLRGRVNDLTRSTIEERPA